MRAVFVACMALVACGGSGSSSGAGGADGGVADGAATTAILPAPTGDAGGLTSIYGRCSSAAAKPSIGSLLEPRAKATLHWPAGWTQLPSNDGAGVSASYTYVATGATSPTQAATRVVLGVVGVSSEAQATESMQGWLKWGRTYGGDGKQLTMGGHPAVLWWGQEPPAQPGCQGCPTDPGPDLVEIGLEVYVGALTNPSGLYMLDARGSARVNAVPDDLFCDIAAMLAGVTF